MTITGTTTNILVEPSGFLPTYNENIIVLSSPNIISDNFKWIVEIWIKAVEGNTFSEKISTLEILPNPDGYGVIDVHRHIENYITSTFFPADTDISSVATATFIPWFIEITENFDNPKWQFSDNWSDGSSTFVGFTTDTNINASYTDFKHPFVDGDIVTILQDTPFTYGEYNTSGVTLTVVDEFTVLTDIPRLGNTPLEPGLMTLDGGGNRTIVQDLSDLRAPYYAFNGVLNYDEFINWDYTEYDLDSVSTSNKLLTNLPDVYNIDKSNHVWVNGASTNALTQGLKITTDNGTFFIDVPTSATTNRNLIKQVKVGYKDLLDNTSSVTTISGSLPMVDDNTTFIEFNYSNSFPSGHQAISEVKRLNIVDKCSKYENYQFFFLDRLGSYIPINFNLVSKKNKTNDKSTWSKNYGRYDSVANAWGYTTYDRGISTLNIVSNETITVTSDWLNDDENNVVQIMLTSPEVYHIDENGVFRAINITTTSWEEKKRVNDKLINYVISFEYAVKNKNQRG